MDLLNVMSQRSPWPQSSVGAMGGDQGQLPPAATPAPRPWGRFLGLRAWPVFQGPASGGLA